MPPDDNNGGELIEAFTDVYTAGQMGRILGAVKSRSDVQSDEIQSQFQNAASLYKLFHRLLPEVQRPALRERRLQGVLNKLCAATAAVRGLSKTDLDYLNAAGQDVQSESLLPRAEWSDARRWAAHYTRLIRAGKIHL